MRTHKEWTDLLMKMARDMPRPLGSHRSRHASAIVYRGTAAGFGFNRMKSHPFQAKYGKNRDAIFLHSEVDAIKNSLRNISLRELTRSTLYVVRVKQVSSTDSTLVQGMSCPCEGCAMAIAEFDIKQVVYTLDGNGLSCDDPA
jgi:deoxycytidylate deaminase